MPIDNTYNEDELVKRIAEGNEHAFGVFFRRFLPRLRAQAMFFITDRYGLTEVLQESFIRIWLSRERLPEIEQLHPYLKRIVMNECFNYLNKLARREKLSQARTPDPEHPLAAEDHVSFKETQSIIQAAIESLPPQRRIIYRMSRNEGLNSSEIGAQLNVSPDYVRRAIGAARQTIKDQLIRAGKRLPSVLL